MEKMVKTVLYQKRIESIKIHRVDFTQTVNNSIEVIINQ